VSVRRKLRVAFFSTGDELVSVGKKLKAGEVYDSNRYTLWGMLSRLGCGRRRPRRGAATTRRSSKPRFRRAAREADAVVTSGGVSVGEADFTKQMMAKLGEVAFWKIAMRRGVPWLSAVSAAAGKLPTLRPSGNPVAVMVTFYHFVRGALLYMTGASDTELPLLPRNRNGDAQEPGRTEYQRGILELKKRGVDRASHGRAGLGHPALMSEANCFVVLGHEQGSVSAGDSVDVMLMDGLV